MRTRLASALAAGTLAGMTLVSAAPALAAEEPYSGGGSGSGGTVGSGSGSGAGGGAGSGTSGGAGSGGALPFTGGELVLGGLAGLGLLAGGTALVVAGRRRDSSVAA